MQITGQRFGSAWPTDHDIYKYFVTFSLDWYSCVSGSHDGNKLTMKIDAGGSRICGQWQETGTV